MGDESEYFDVKFAGEAAEQMTAILREINPDFAPADEMILKMEIGPCVRCGEKPEDGQLAACDPVGITKDGVLIGETICHRCLKLEAEADD